MIVPATGLFFVLEKFTGSLFYRGGKVYPSIDKTRKTDMNLLKDLFFFSSSKRYSSFLGWCILCVLF